METRPILLLVGLLLGGIVVAAEVYRWVDEDGVVHYSDQPQPGAERIQIEESNTFTGRRVEPRSAESEDESEDPSQADEPFRYESITVSSPAAEETLWNIEGILNVSLALTPGLQSGHQIRVYFDGTPRMVNGTSFQIEEVWRGVHNIQAEVLDETGKMMIRSQTNRFYVQQNTVAF